MGVGRTRFPSTPRSASVARFRIGAILCERRVGGSAAGDRFLRRCRSAAPRACWVGGPTGRRRGNDAACRRVSSSQAAITRAATLNQRVRRSRSRNVEAGGISRVRIGRAIPAHRAARWPYAWSVYPGHSRIVNPPLYDGRVPGAGILRLPRGRGRPFRAAGPGRASARAVVGCCSR